MEADAFSQALVTHRHPFIAQRAIGHARHVCRVAPGASTRRLRREFLFLTSNKMGRTSHLRFGGGGRFDAIAHDCSFCCKICDKISGSLYAGSFWDEAHLPQSTQCLSRESNVPEF